MTHLPAGTVMVPDRCDSWNTRGVSDRASSAVGEYHPGQWGLQEQATNLSAEIRTYLIEHVGSARPWPMRPPDLQGIDAPTIESALLSRLAGIVGEDNLDTTPRGRWHAVGGASYLDYVRQRAGDCSGVPDAVITAAHHDEVQAVIEECSREGVPVVPLGGGTSVVGGLRCDRPHVAISTSRMRAVIDIDDVAGLVRVESGITGPILEAILAPRGLTLGHLPQSWQRASIGGYLATRSAGQASTGYGRSDDMVESVLVATPAGSLSAGHVPSSAAGPDLLQLVIGSEGAFGVITEASLRVRRLPVASRYEAVIFPNFDAGREAFRELAQSRITADVMRLSDAQETATSLMMSAPGGLMGSALTAYLRRRGVPSGDGALAILGWEAVDSDIVKSRRGSAIEVLRRHGAVSLGKRPGGSWQRHRFDGPHLRDALMDAGYLVETVETSTTWSNLSSLRAAVHRALEHSLTSSVTRPYVMTHISHVYETGASLYTTVIAVADQNNPVGQWTSAKAAVSDAIVSGGGTITHHHAIGRDHARWLPDEIGALGLETLKAVKSTLDPAGICNPGVLGLT